MRLFEHPDFDQAVYRAAEHFRPGIHRDNREATFGETLRRLPRPAANLENLIALLEIGV